VKRHVVLLDDRMSIGRQVSFMALTPADLGGCGHTNRWTSSNMSILDSLKGLFGGRKSEAKQGVDKAAGIADAKTGGQHTDKIDKGADTAKDQIDKLQ
jgi:hypothetical protein